MKLKRYYLFSVFVSLMVITSVFSQPIPVSLPDTSGNSGDTLAIPITVGDLTGQNIIAYQTTVTFDGNILNCIGANSTGTLTESFNTIVNCAVPGEITVGAFGTTSPLSGAGTLVYLLLEVTGQPGETTALTFSTFIFNAGTPAASTTNGSVTINVPNNPPVLTPIANQSMDEGSTLDVPVSATDDPGDVITLTVNNLPAFGSFTDNGDGTGTISFAPGFDDAGSYPNIEVVAMDDGTPSLSDTTTFTLTVNNVNRAPVLGPISNKSMNEGETLDVPVSSTDPDGDNITLTGNNLPSFGSFTDNGDGTGLITFTPDSTQAGSYPNIEVIAMDNGGLSDTVYFDLTVNDVPPPSKVLISEIVVTPTGGEFVEIYNPGFEAVDLSDYYLTDATFAGDGSYYYNIVTDTLAGGGGFGDFHARFPAGATILPGEYQTIAMHGTNFVGEYGVQPTYELFETDPGIPDMLEALPGSINNQGGLTNSDEVVILYYWNGINDLVMDVDYLIYDQNTPSAPNEAVDKTGIKRDGPDLNADSTEYLPDTPIASQLSAPNHGSGYSVHRIDYTEGAQIASGGNGVTGADETSEDLNNTFTNFSIPTPNAAYQPPPPDTAAVILAAQIGGDSQYRTFWVNGSWDADGTYDPTWSGPMVELNDNGIDPDAVAGDNIFTGSVALVVDNAHTYDWWTGSEDDANSVLEDGVGFNVTSMDTVFVDTLIVDGNNGINEWVISLAGSFNGWNNSSDDMTRNGTVWSIQIQLDAGTHEYKYAVMHQWNAAYGQGGVGGAGSNYSYTALDSGIYEFTFDDSDNSQTVTPILPIDPPGEIPTDFALDQNYPNPFNPTTTIKYALKENAHVTLEIYNVLGQLVKTLVNENQTAGYKQISWNGTNEDGVKAGSGIYIYRIEANDFVQLKKMILLK